MSEEITQWEYTSVNAHNGKETVEELNKLGKEGWETTGNNTMLNTYAHDIILKRKKRSTNPSYDNGYSR